MKYCKYCGAECSDDATFCPECGGLIGVKEDQKYKKDAEKTFEGKSKRSKLAAGLLQIFLGGLGVGRFYTGHIGIAIAQILTNIFLCGIGAIWAFIDGIIILCSKEVFDAEGKIME